MNTNRQTAVMKESKMKITTSKLIRWAGLAAMLAGSFYVAIGFFHPVKSLSTVTTTEWAVIHSLAFAMSFFGLLGITGIYARQVEEAGWLGLAGYILLSLWLVLLAPFTFAEVFILPPLATEAPAFVESFLGVFTGHAHPGGVDLGAMKTIWDLDGFVYILGGLLFGIATLRAGILSRWPAGLLVAAALVTPAGALLPHEHMALVAVPVGLALAWLGYTLWSERSEKATQPVPTRVSPQLSQSAGR
ncbi:MAG: hypothetical protein M3437_16375 [Chloroflexota bacterium]|nr:hypothetical protein [Chloroflexota bacterium]MDQ5864823.1 hypothetical protein [Chloroflexota bacterium]